MGQTRWYKKMDPKIMWFIRSAMGTGGDNAPIQVVELPNNVEQVAEWKHNTQQYPTNKNIKRYPVSIKEETQSTGSKYPLEC